MNKKCSVCKTKTEHAFKEKVLNKYKVDYYYCHNCGFLQTEEPYWLKEAYVRSIVDADTGLIQRNIDLSRKLICVLFYLNNDKNLYLDIAGGYGVLTRLMRDYGFDYYWSDKYCNNIFAKGFERPDKELKYSAVTAFEVLEHVINPVKFIELTLKENNTNTIIFSSLLFKDKPPNPQDWWYYAFPTGQHISFYQKKTLRKIGENLGLNIYSAWGMHILTDKHLNNWLYSILSSPASTVLSKLITIFMKSKTFSDHELLMNITGTTDNK